MPNAEPGIQNNLNNAPPIFFRSGTPFQMRALSPLKMDYTGLLKNNVGKDGIKAANITGTTSIAAVDAISNTPETGVKKFGEDLEGLDDDNNGVEKTKFNEGLKKRIDSAGNPAKKQRLQNKLERKQIKQGARAEKLKVRGGDQKSKLIERKYNEKNIIKRGLDKTQETDLSVDSKKLKLPKVNSNFDFDAQINKLKLRDEVTPSASAVTGSKDSNKTTNTMGDDIAEYLTSGGNVPDSLKPKTNEEIQEEMKEIQKKLEIEDTIGKGDTFRSGINYNSPLNYNPFSPRQQDIVGQVYNPSGNDISEFQDGQAFNKSASNPNTYNQPAIPTEADTTMNDLQTGNAPMGAFGDDLSGAMISPTGLAPEQGMGSTQFGGVTPNLTRKEIRRQRRQENRQYRRTGIRPFGG